jgi:hypothetical protein
VPRIEVPPAYLAQLATTNFFSGLGLLLAQGLAYRQGWYAPEQQGPLSPIAPGWLGQRPIAFPFVIAVGP